MQKIKFAGLSRIGWMRLVFDYFSLGSMPLIGPPIILRPHKDAQGNWHALVIFVDAKKWPAGKQVFLNGQPRSVSLDLYDAMKADPQLSDFL